MGAPIVSSPFSVLLNPGEPGVTEPGEGPPVTLDIGGSITKMFTGILSNGLELVVDGFQVGVVNPFAFDLAVYDYEQAFRLHLHKTRLRSPIDFDLQLLSGSKQTRALPRGPT